jgi:lysophospholipase L1-like esterase
MHIRSFTAVVAIFCLLAVPLPAADYVQPRSGLANSFQKFAGSQKTQAYTKITYFGGSITAGAGSSKPEFCWRSLLQRHLEREFPGARLAENNAAIGGTGSWLGAFRTKNQALYGGAALVIVEFAVNDGGAPEAQVLSAMEGIVRQIRRSDAATDILFVYTLSHTHLAMYDAGQLPPTVQWHERIAEHYGIPSVHLAQFAFDKIKAGELAFHEFANDGVHPTDRGYALYFEALKPFIAQCKSATTAPKRHALPPPLTAAPMENAKCVPYEWTTLDGAWKRGRKSPVEPFLHVLESDAAGAMLSFRFKGAQCGLFDAIGLDTGDLEIAVDGGEWKPLANWDHYAKNYIRPHARPLAQGLDPAQWHEVKVRIAEKIPGESKGRFARIGYLLADGEVEEPFAKLDPLQHIDAVWATIQQPLKVELAANRFQYLPETMKRLREGGSLRMVLLGDSIMGDTSSSQFDLLLGRTYPTAKIQRILSNRGSTGCWWYQDENRVEDYVFKHRPDLLMIGGISQRGDIEAIRAVIHQVRAKLPCEILLMTPAFGPMTEALVKDWRYQIDPASDDYRAQLRRLAAEEKCAFVDMTGPWWQFVKDSGADYGYFRRDAVHANERGFQILGRIVEKYFEP